MRFGGRTQLIGMSLLAMVSMSAASEMILPLGEGIFNKRQDTTAVSSGGESPAATSENTPAPSNSPSDEDTSAAPSATPTPSAAPSSAPSSAGDDNTSQDQTSAQQTSNNPSPTSGNGNGGTTTVRTTETPSVVTTPLVTRVTRQTVVTVQVTSGTSVFDAPVTTDITSDMTTGSTVETLNPQLSDNGNGNGGSSLSDKNQKIVGGVVGGIGGALLIGGIVLVFLRLRKKRQNKVQIDDDFAGMDYKQNENSRNSEPLNSSPFQNNLDQYHNPPPRPNAAANF